MENGGKDGNGSVKPMKVTPFTLIVTVCQMYHVFHINSLTTSDENS